MKVAANEEKLTLIVEVEGRKYRYSDKIHNSDELGYLQDRLKWYEANNKLNTCLATEFSAL